jgi:hypothetical protein
LVKQLKVIGGFLYIQKERHPELGLLPNRMPFSQYNRAPRMARPVLQDYPGTIHMQVILR